MKLKENHSDQETEKMNYDLRPKKKDKYAQPGYVMSMTGGEETGLPTAVGMNTKERERLSSMGLGSSSNNRKKIRKFIGIK